MGLATSAHKFWGYVVVEASWSDLQRYGLFLGQTRQYCNNVRNIYWWLLASGHVFLAARWWCTQSSPYAHVIILKNTLVVILCSSELVWDRFLYVFSWALFGLSIWGWLQIDDNWKKNRIQRLWIKRLDIELEAFIKQNKSTSCKGQHLLLICDVPNSSLNLSYATHSFKMSNA
jgi:hypothetical protein